MVRRYMVQTSFKLTKQFLPKNMLMVLASSRWVLFLWCLLMVCAASAQGPIKPQAKPAIDKIGYRPDDPSNLPAFDHFYNLDYDRSIQEFEQVVKRHPDDA